MRETLVDEILAIHPEHSREKLQLILAAFSHAKTERLPRRDLAEIIHYAASITPANPVRCLLRRDSGHQDGPTSIYVIGHDHAMLFSILTGALASAGFDIRRGSLITSERIGGKRLIIDHFSGNLPRKTDSPSWFQGFTKTMEDMYFILEKGGSPEQKQELIQQRIIEMVSTSLEQRSTPKDSLLNPINLRIEQKPDSTLIEIKSSDTPLFLFSLSSVLSLHRLRIEQVNIETKNGRLIDSIEFTDNRGNPITSEKKLNRIKLSILISKQFTYFLDQAPDPTKALTRFDDLIQDVRQLKAGEDIRQMLASPEFHGELARLLGTSDFIWEDFIRIQRDSILPMLKNVNRSRLLSFEPEEMADALTRHLENFDGPDLERELNAFKNRQSFLIDMDHILVRDLDFFFLSRRLSALADAVINAACEIAYRNCVDLYGVPRTAGGLEPHWAVFGLGKLGGQAMGYASDLELLFIYSDSGKSDGSKALANRDFFEKMFKRAAGLISAKKEGIFQVDLRLRPHGEDGPVAVKLDKFQAYYGEDGKAHSAERLALVRLRRIGGEQRLGEEILSIRDHIVYESDSIDLPELRDLRRIQLEEKLEEGRINAKFSPGGLVDLEYNVQILQVIHGRGHPHIRGPGIHTALHELQRLGTIDRDESLAMIQAYRFHRNLINGLRMLRGNADDLFLPDAAQREFRHLARRIGYRRNGELSESDQLKIDFETHSAKVRQFVERHLGRDAIPGDRRMTVVDLVLGATIDDESPGEFTALFASSGFSEPRKAQVNLKRIAEGLGSQSDFIRLIILAWERICRSADPDMALNNWEQFVANLSDPQEHILQLLSQPRRMDILYQLLASSQYLADTLIQNPGFFLWATDPMVVNRPRTQIDMEETLAAEAASAVDRLDWQNRIRLMRKREILRIGVRDIALGVKIEEIMGEISFLARGCCEVSLKEAWRREQQKSPEQDIKSASQRVSVLAFGKLGGWELNYSSDIDLLCVYDADPHANRDNENQLYTRVFREMVKDLNDFTSEGQAYRVDMRLRPYGASGPLVSSLSSAFSYYQKQAEPWEFQALVKLKPVAGNLVLGERFLENLKPVFDNVWEVHDPRENIRKMREKSIAHHVGGSGSDLNDRDADIMAGFDVKNDRGGIRDIEFFIQGKQMLHSADYPAVLTGNSLRGLQLLLRADLISSELAARLSEYYRFFRKVEHYLQLAQNRQEHRLPDKQEDRAKLARCIQPQSTTEGFFRYFSSALKEVHAVYRGFISQS